MAASSPPKRFSLRNDDVRSARPWARTSPSKSKVLTMGVPRSSESARSPSPPKPRHSIVPRAFSMSAAAMSALTPSSSPCNRNSPLSRGETETPSPAAAVRGRMTRASSTCSRVTVSLKSRMKMGSCARSTGARSTSPKRPTSVSIRAVSFSAARSCAAAKRVFGVSTTAVTAPAVPLVSLPWVGRASSSPRSRPASIVSTSPWVTSASSGKVRTSLQSCSRRSRCG